MSITTHCVRGIGPPASVAPAKPVLVARVAELGFVSERHCAAAVRHVRDCEVLRAVARHRAEYVLVRADFKLNERSLPLQAHAVVPCDSVGMAIVLGGEEQRRTRKRKERAG